MPAGDEPVPGRGFSRLSLLGLAISVVAVGGVVWWAVHQEPPQFPDTAGEWGALAAAVAIYAVATLVRGERWRLLLRAEGGTPSRADAQALNVVGYAVNNMLPARAGDAVRIFLMAPRAAMSKKSVLGTLLAERLLDIARHPGAVPRRRLRTARRGGRRRGRLDRCSPPRSGRRPALGVRARPPQRAPARHRRAGALLHAAAARPPRAHAARAHVLIWALEAGVWMTTGAAAGFPMDPIEGCYIVALASVFALIPSGPGYAGTQDAAAVTGILALGGTHSQAVDVPDPRPLRDRRADHRRRPRAAGHALRRPPRACRPVR